MPTTNPLKVIKYAIAEHAIIYKSNIRWHCDLALSILDLHRSRLDTAYWTNSKLHFLS